GNDEVAKQFDAKAEAIKRELQNRLWDERRQFFLQMYRRDEERDGFLVKALSKTYETGQFAGSPHGRELIGYVPWQFNMPDRDRGFEHAWKFLMDPDFFYATFGPCTVERHDPMFQLQRWCCWWSGQSWPYATSQTLKAMANVLQNYEQSHVTPSDYAKLLSIYARSHRKNGKPYLAEALHPDTGSFDGHDGYNHSEHYFHSGFCDLVITGLAGLKTRDDSVLEVHPLIPEAWDYFAVEDVPYRGHRLTIAWDRSGDRYQLGPGLHVLVDGQRLAGAKRIERITVQLPQRNQPKESIEPRMNFAVNNDGDYFPRFTASHTASDSSLAKVNDGNYWYHKDPPNRWTSAGSAQARDWVMLDLGTSREIDTAKLYFLGDEPGIAPPERVLLEYMDGDAWRPVPDAKPSEAQPRGHAPYTIRFSPLKVQQLRATLTHRPAGKAGLTEFEVWGDAVPTYTPPAPPAGNLAYNPRREGFPKIKASHFDRFGGKPENAIDGKVNFLPNPVNRWTSYESPLDVDWLEIDFGKEQTIGRVELYIYDDRGGVQAPSKYQVQCWVDDQWRDVQEAIATPAEPLGGAVNSLRFRAQKTQKIRVLFTNKGKARSGVTELEAWSE
ncbi:MAG: Beta-L-arabinobiosidase precursor, partial [Planctomycetota bacterium]